MTPPHAETAEATWPAADVQHVGPWVIREGLGGGKRVSATTPHGSWTESDITQAEAAMEALGQDKLFMLQDSETKLDSALDARGYRVIDPVHVYSAPIERISKGPLPYATAMTVWPPLAIQTELWAAGGIGPARLNVMQRVNGAKTSILGRAKDQPAGTAFVALHGACAMIHAIEVTPKLRREGVARNMLWAAAHWAQAEGASELTLLVTKDNTGANALYTSLGMDVVGHYHYRLK